MLTDGKLTFEDGLVVLGKVTLPGIYVQMQINAGVRFDRAQRDHMSGKNKIPLGWEDADIRFTADLLTDDDSDCYDKLTVINKIFKGADKGANPRVYDVTGRHLRARGVNRVVFSGLDSTDSDQDDVIQVTLVFSEHLPAVIKREKQVVAQKKAVGATPPATKASPAAAPAITADSTNPFVAGFNKGYN